MPPKVIAKAKAKGKAKAKAKAVAKAMAVVGRRRGALRRPAVRGVVAGPTTIRDRWLAGDLVEAHQVDLLLLAPGDHIVLEQSYYFHQECKLAGVLTGIDVRGDEVTLRVKLSGTTHEGVLKLQSGRPELVFRVHRCPPGCGQEETAEDLAHVVKMRKVLEIDREDGWVRNLEKVAPAEDELEALRKRQQERSPLRPGDAGKRPDHEKPEDGKEKAKKKEKKKEKKEKKDRKSDQESSDGAPVNGRRPKAANKKDAKVLFEGTGLDPKERVRGRVFKAARRHLKKKSRRSTSSSSSGRSSKDSESEGGMEMSEESVFQVSSKVKLVAENYPGALAGQALAHMRSVLLTEIGQDDRSGLLKGVALAYYRQVLQGRAVGPAQRELLTIATAIDSLLAGKVASTVDLLVQRLKSSESTLSGNHWSVSQRLEVLPSEHQIITPGSELLEARKESYTDYRLRRDASHPDGRPNPGGKGLRQGKDPREEPRRQGGKKGGKGQNAKGDPGKRAKEDPGRGEK
eukprot:s406_g14.t1